MTDRLNAFAARLKQATAAHDAAHEDAERRKRERIRKAGSEALAQAEREAEPVPKPVNSTDVREWFQSGVNALYQREIKLANWGARERALAKKLLDEYGVDLTRQAVEYFVGNWKQIAQRGKFRGLPTVNLMFAMRDTIFGEVQLGGKTYGAREERLNVDEHDATKVEDTDVGW